jgi:hypothetical protein
LLGVPERSHERFAVFRLLIDHPVANQFLVGGSFDELIEYVVVPFAS